MLDLSLGKIAAVAPNLHLSSIWNAESGTTLFLSLFRALPCPGSRTRVTKLTASRGYRFFFVLSLECSHAPLPRHYPLVAASPQQIHPAGHHASRLLTAAPREYSRIAAKCSDKRMLLPLRGSPPARRLREDVRFEKVLTLVGKNVRETSHAIAGRKFQRRAEVSASRTSGACQALKEVLISKSLVESIWLHDEPT